jgi:hypothetical protein
MNPGEVVARNQLAQIVRAMLRREQTFFEGARVVVELRSQIGGVQESDPDFNAFVLIYSETDHLPHEAQRHLWKPDVLARLEPEFKKTEIWAASFASEACENLLKRFGGEDVSHLPHK